jgi:Predicted xylanase/chitin deacetylase
MPTGIRSASRAAWSTERVPQLALKIDVDTYRGTRTGVPRLLDTLARHRARATFLFSLGPDHTGRALARVFRRGFLDKVARTSVLDHYGVKTLLYGVLLPGPDIGRRCADTLRRVQQAGHETGVHCWDHVRWQDQVGARDAAWTAAEMRRAQQRYIDIFGAPPRVHGAAGWQMNAAAYALQTELGFAYASDTRGDCPFVPMVDGVAAPCPQLPTTLPTLDELIGLDGVTPANVHERLLAQTSAPPAHGHVYTLHAELEGQKLLPVFERLLAGWRAQGYDLCSLGDMFATLDPDTLPRHAVHDAEIAGRSGTLARQILAPSA